MNRFLKIDPPLYPVNIDGCGCYINDRGSVILESAYPRVGWFYCGRAPVWNGTSYGFIDSQGILVVEPTFSDVMSFSEDVCGAAVQGKWGLIDKYGKWVIYPEYDDIGSCSAGIIGVSKRRGVDLSYVDLSNTVIGPDVGTRAMSAYSEGLLAAEDSSVEKYGYRDLNGEWAIAPTYSSVGEFSEGLADVKRPVGKDEMTGYIDRSGHIVLPFEFITAHSPFSCGLAVACKKRRRKLLWGAINTDGEWIVETQYSYLQEFSDGLAMFHPDDESVMGFIDTKGCEVFRSTWKAVVVPFTHGVALVRDEKEWFYINNHG